MIEAFLDIETTGLSSVYDGITVVGIYLTEGSYDRFVQLVGDEINKANLLSALRGVGIIYTYNGSRFDLPFIRDYLDLDLTAMYRHHDLMYDCWENNLYGGFKGVEVQLGIARQLKNVDGREAVRLWYKYRNHQDEKALSTLLFYNREDVVNLKALKGILAPKNTW